MAVAAINSLYEGQRRAFGICDVFDTLRRRIASSDFSGAAYVAYASFGRLVRRRISSSAFGTHDRVDWRPPAEHDVRCNLKRLPAGAEGDDGLAIFRHRDHY